MIEQKNKKLIDPVDFHIGQRLRSKRISLLVDMAVLGEAVGVTPQQVQKYESGVNRISAGDLFGIAKALNVDIAYFFEGLGLPALKMNAFRAESYIDPMRNREAVAFIHSFLKVDNAVVRKNIHRLVKSLADMYSHMAGVEAAVAKTGMVCLGALHPGAGDGAPKSAGTLVLVGNAGPDMWNAFSAERQEGADPLDAWTRRKLDGVCRELGANDVLYASGKPHHPFVKWAQRAGIAHPSLIGLNIHPEYGLWHAYRGALVFEEKLDMPPAGPTKNPCSSCKDKPCLSACSAGAFDGGKYDASACAGLLQKPAGVNCMSNGCAARHACHVGKEYTYDKAQSAFHMRAFAASQPTA